ncbi:MAG TPA: ATP synthase F1 subunit gamma [Blastocatellia bacterium]|nr:ATP synthase F1 subunit gamma [Blastocatellia bacterium]
MANLQDLRRRVRSVRNMQKITKAMKMVAAARLRRAQERVSAARPYADTMTRVLGRLAARAGDYHHPLLDQRGDEHYVLALVTADKGLCGAFNTNLIKAAQQFIRENESKHVDLVAVGRKGRDFFRRRPVTILRDYINITAGTVNHEDAAVIARELMETYTAEGSTIDRVFLVYNEFKSVLSQQVTIKQLLPIGAEAFGGADEASSALRGGVATVPPAATPQSEVSIDYLYEQPPAEIFGNLLPRYVETQVFYALLESVASEHGARMTAMDSASKNAGEVIDTLTLNMNRVRQASITREIIEVVSGAQALEG